MSIEFLTLATYGDQIELDINLNDHHNYIDWTERNFEYVRYNPRKDIERYGLSLTSLDGGLSGRPDLDSLYEYNKENNTSYTERDFNVFTAAFNYPNLQKIIEPWKNDIFRSHILKLNPGGYFPAHRDSKSAVIDSFRLILPLGNCNPPSVYFIVDGTITNWNLGTLYYINTSKSHTLFNASFNPSYWIVFNIDCNIDTVNNVLQRTKQK